MARIVRRARMFQSDIESDSPYLATENISLFLRLRALPRYRLPFGDVHFLSLVAVRISMSVPDAFERNACIHIRLRVTEKDVVFPMCLVVVYNVAARDISRLYAPVTFYVRTLRCGSARPLLGYRYHG
jgi:hypothetical protein